MAVALKEGGEVDLAALLLLLMISLHGKTEFPFLSVIVFFPKGLGLR